MEKIIKTYVKPQASDNYTFSRPAPYRTYAKILNYINSFPYATRNEIMKNVFQTNDPGYYCTIWRSLGRKNLINMWRDGNTVRYTITEEGMKVLNECFIGLPLC